VLQQGKKIFQKYFTDEGHAEQTHPFISSIQTPNTHGLLEQPSTLPSPPLLLLLLMPLIEHPNNTTQLINM
jgi:hypothetical protein